MRRMRMSNSRLYHYEYEYARFDHSIGYALTRCEYDTIAGKNGELVLVPWYSKLGKLYVILAHTYV